MNKRGAEGTGSIQELIDDELDRVQGGQGIDIVRMPPQPRDPNEDFVVTDRQGFVD